MEGGFNMKSQDLKLRNQIEPESPRRSLFGSSLCRHFCFIRPPKKCFVCPILLFMTIWRVPPLLHIFCFPCPWRFLQSTLQIVGEVSVRVAPTIHLYFYISSNNDGFRRQPCCAVSLLPTVTHRSVPPLLLLSSPRATQLPWPLRPTEPSAM